jgi:hypothetical protein
LFGQNQALEILLLLDNLLGASLKGSVVFVGNVLPNIYGGNCALTSFPEYES